MSIIKKKKQTKIGKQKFPQNIFLDYGFKTENKQNPPPSSPNEM